MPTKSVPAPISTSPSHAGPRLHAPDRSDWRLASGLGLAKLALHLGVLTRYGYHHDELYFLACGQHLDWGYVDHPPLVPWLARLSSELFGPHPSALAHFGLRLFASVSMALVVVAIALLVRRMGGGRWAMAVGAGAWMLGPVALRTGNLFCIPAFEHLFWILAAHSVLNVAEAASPTGVRRAWLGLGAICGFGLLTKVSMLFFGLGVLVATLLMPALRRQLRSPWPYVGGASAFGIASPYLFWQVAHGWPTVEFLRAQSSVVESISRVQFVLGQLLYQGAGGALIWGAGLAFFLSSAGRRFRYFGWIYLTVFVFLLLAQSKIYYLSPAYPMLFAGGGVALERLASRLRRPAWLRLGVPAFVGIPALVFLPISLPLLPIDDTEAFIRRATFGAFENVYELTADLRGMFGWEERVAAVAEVYHALPEAERARTLVIARWYGPAGAVDLFGREKGLPPAVSTHMSYHIWGLPDGDWTTVLAVDIRRQELERYFGEVTLAKEIELEDVNPWERRFAVHLGRQPKVDLREAWPSLGDYGH